MFCHQHQVLALFCQVHLSPDLCYVPFYCDGPPSHQLCSLVFPISKLNSIIVSHQKADSVLTLYHWSMALINGYWSVPFTELGNDCNHNVVRWWKKLFSHWKCYTQMNRNILGFTYLDDWSCIKTITVSNFPAFCYFLPLAVCLMCFLGVFCAFLVFAWSELLCIMYFLYFTVTIELLFSLSFVPESCIWVLLCLHYCPWEEESFKKSKWIRLLWTN